jgi:Arc/MetJ-type ribon-helix-helix transcriptional regulator
MSSSKKRRGRLASFTVDDRFEEEMEGLKGEGYSRSASELVRAGLTALSEMSRERVLELMAERRRGA